MHCVRALLLAFGLGLAAAPTALAIPTCPPTGCVTQVPVTASITGPDHAVRTGDAVTFDASGSHGGTDSSGEYKPITKVEWDLDGQTGFEHNTGTGTSKSVTYPAGQALGNLTVRVKVTSANGTSTSSRTIDIRNRRPVVGLHIDDDTPVTGQQIALTGTMIDADSSWVDFGWRFDNGQVCTVVSGNCPDRLHTRSYGTPGTYSVTFVAFDADGGESETSRTITVRAAPVAVVEAPESALAGTDVTLDASASTGSGPLTYRWDVDGDQANGYEVDGGTTPTLTRSFPAGDRQLRVKITDAGGASAETARSFTAHTAPTADFTYAPADPIAGQEVAFTATAADDEGIAEIAWDLDGDAGNGFEHGQEEGAKRTFATPGAYTVRLRVEDTRGAETVVTKTLTVKAKPVVEEPKGEDEPAGGDVKEDRPATGGSAPAAAPGAPVTATADPATAPSQQRFAQPAPAAKKAAKKAKKRCAKPKGKKARGKKARKRCGKAKKPRGAKKRR